MNRRRDGNLTVVLKFPNSTSARYDLRANHRSRPQDVAHGLLSVV
ncbi:hypothetical protein PC129_g12533 [Phytophthora cactorum]|uniref:Uncharacterized protein n=1 Tax=Phytophthora cactorum TaxID=29920 RepID=A0A329RAR9_9STRA|nr:hypothetical protein Pcac1_g5137 [Phytophthora cactorum]KAG2814911.1 hypothetical protein PC112_g14115 [Phytophthora cactorum]KAG2903051.1 hypothetical protein PC114_g12448 [Phytophthora cactorum]KAG2916022.1 hypothetical protein PC115_g11197 [Phytophthora cactorum]KAG2919020.1 hypothetical protein PC117_g16882 [Phytophthora cactorum]